MMKFELPCEIVKDLLPNYIDGLTGESTQESIKAHMKDCEKCRKLCADMKNDVKNAEAIIDKKSMDDSKLYKKIKKQLHKKVWIVGAVGIAAVLLVIGGKNLLYDAYIKNVSYEDIEINTTIYTKEDYLEKNPDVESDFYVEESNDYVDHDNNRVSQIDEVEYFTVVEMSSPYILQEINYIDDNRNDGVIYVSSAKTTVLNNQLPQGEYVSASTYFKQLDKIIFLDGEKQIVMWEREE